MKYVLHIDTKELENIKKKVNVIWESDLFKGIIFVEVSDVNILHNIKGINCIEENNIGTFNTLQTIKL